MKIVKKNILRVTAASIIIMAGVFASQAVAKKDRDWSDLYGEKRREEQKRMDEEQKLREDFEKRLIYSGK